MVINAALEKMLQLLFELHVITAAGVCLWYVSHEKANCTVAFKLQVVERAERITNREASRKFGVDEKRVGEWKLQ